MNSITAIPVLKCSRNLKKDIEVDVFDKQILFSFVLKERSHGISTNTSQFL
jgi:hypothetical protein